MVAVLCGESPASGEFGRQSVAMPDHQESDRTRLSFRRRLPHRSYRLKHGDTLLRRLDGLVVPPRAQAICASLCGRPTCQLGRLTTDVEGRAADLLGR